MHEIIKTALILPYSSRSFSIPQCLSCTHVHMNNPTDTPAVPHSLAALLDYLVRIALIKKRLISKQWGFVRIAQVRVRNFPLLWWPICQWGIITFIEPNICESCLLANRQANCYHAPFLGLRRPSWYQINYVQVSLMWDSRSSLFCFSDEIHTRRTSRRLICARHTTSYYTHRREDRITEYKSFVVKLEVRGTLGRPGHRYRNNIIMDRREIA